MFGTSIPSASFSRFLACAVCSGLLGLPACMEKAENSPDRRPGPPQEMQGQSAKEGSPDGRGIAPATGPVPMIDQPPLVSPDEITRRTNASALIGHQVQWRNVPVLRVLSDQYVLVGTQSDRGVLVRLKELIPGLKPGERLNVSGMIAQLGEDLAHWELDPAEKRSIERLSVFVNAFQSEKSAAP